MSKESRIHKDLTYPYYIEVPLTEDESEWTNLKIRNREDEEDLKKYYPEFFENA